MNTSTNSERLKKVMRIALVGIRPADQVMLKGYLRILLRLEADLEWVAANHEAVDLFMINSEFHQSESVQRLLAAKPNAGVLYISRNEVGDGHLTGNQLTLPLKELEELSQWLQQNIQNNSSIAASSPTATQNTTQSAATTNSPTTRQTLDDVLASRNATNTTGSTVANHPSASSANTNATTNTATPAATPAPTVTTQPILELIKVIAQLQRREDSLFSLVSADGSVLAHIHAKQQRIWLGNNEIDLSQSLSLKPAANFHADPAQSTDLLQWLWQQATTQAPKLISVLRPQMLYHITSWIKPSEGAARHEQLKIQAVLESREVTLAQLASLSQCDHNTIKRTVIGLVIAGTMSPSVYQELQRHFESLQTSPSTSQSTEPPAEISQPIQGVTQANTALQNTQGQGSQSAVAQEVTQTAGNEGMKGFLSRLRSKLGI